MEYVHGGDIYTYGDVLDFSVNVNPYGPSEEVLEAAKRSMDEVSLYPDSQCRRLRKRLAEKKSLPEEYFLHKTLENFLLLKFLSLQLSSGKIYLLP